MKMDKICQIVCLRQLMMRWRQLSLRCHSIHSNFVSETFKSNPSRVQRTRSGSLAVYVGGERKRFEIPIRFLNLPIFAGLLKKAEEEFEFQCNGGLVLPCEVAVFRELIKYLCKHENRFGKFSLEEFVKMLMLCLLRRWAVKRDFDRLKR